uniref:Tetratricopeptide repeat protein 5 OB fold domain-containing protein n=1 Tax=Gopherus agassizii TaxID=38772 RepID=A0A452HWK6_9SAUR
MSRHSSFLSYSHPSLHPFILSCIHPSHHPSSAISVRPSFHPSSAVSIHLPQLYASVHSSSAIAIPPPIIICSHPFNPPSSAIPLQPASHSSLMPSVHLFSVLTSLSFCHRHPRKCLPLLFFNTGQNPNISQQALSAYHCAVFLLGQLHKYEENYTEALESFFHAASFESAWPKLWQPQQQLLDFLECLLENTGKVKGNKLQSTLGSLHPSQLGPCGDGRYQGSLGQKVALEHWLLSALYTIHPSPQLLSQHLAHVLAWFPGSTFSMADSEGPCFAVTVYNMVQSWGVVIGDLVAIPEPHIQHQFRLVLSAGGIHRPGPVGEEGYGKSYPSSPTEHGVASLPTLANSH